MFGCLIDNNSQKLTDITARHIRYLFGLMLEASMYFADVDVRTCVASWEKVQRLHSLLVRRPFDCAMLASFHAI